MKKTMKLLAVLALGATLVGCGGHKYEGKWKSESKALNQTIVEVIDFGSDTFTDAEGIVTEGVTYTIRKTPSEAEILVLTLPTQKEVLFHIQDEDTLTQDFGFLGKTKLVRMD